MQFRGTPEQRVRQLSPLIGASEFRSNLFGALQGTVVRGPCVGVFLTRAGLATAVVA